MIVGTVGHIDHGKTQLVRALTGVDTDRLKEEKSRGISIELGYAFLALSDGNVLGFVDVPGHERLIHTMVAGIGGIDLALLVIAADDGVMPQTREHVAILHLLGIRRAAVAVTKVDRVDPGRIQTVYQQLDTLFAATPLASAPRFAINATDLDDRGVSDLSAWLTSTAHDTGARPTHDYFRMAIDRVFTLAGRGTIVTGTVRAGRVTVGDSLMVMPAGLPARVRSIHAQNREVISGVAGERCALNLVGVERQALSRGDWIAHPRVLRPALRFDVRLRWLAASDAQRLRSNALHIHWGTVDRLADVVRLGAAPATDGYGFAQLVFDRPVCASSGDAFIIRDAQALRTLGGGVILDPSAPARHRGSPERLAYLAAIHSCLMGAGAAPLLGAAPRGIPLQDIARLLEREAQHVSLPAGARIVASSAEPMVFDGDHWQALLGGVRDTLRRFHAEHADEPGLDRGRLRRMACPTMPEAVWREVIEELICRGDVMLTGPWLRLPEHRTTLNAEEQSLADELQVALMAGPFEPKWVRDLALCVGSTEQAVRRVLLKQSMHGAVYQIVRDLFCAAPAIQEFTKALRMVEQRDGVIQVAQYRDVVGVGRKRAIQILEFFDRIGYTRRTGDVRIMRADSHGHENA